tara:strand:+ start:158 stop:400 length:243 start_codon:yes stop_codon:yes gene_type:complete
MIFNELNPIREQLKRIEDKIDGNHQNRYLSIKEVSNLVSCSPSTIRRQVAKGALKCSRRLGKLLFEEVEVRNWLNEKKSI